MIKHTLDHLWDKYGKEPFWMHESIPHIMKEQKLSKPKAEKSILNSMVGGAIIVIGSSHTVKNCTCDSNTPHTHYGGDLQFKFYLPIWDENTPREFNKI